jgi:hypothetical protein
MSEHESHAESKAQIDEIRHDFNNWFQDLMAEQTEMEMDEECRGARAEVLLLQRGGILTPAEAARETECLPAVVSAQRWDSETQQHLNTGRRTFNRKRFEKWYYSQKLGGHHGNEKVGLSDQYIAEFQRSNHLNDCLLHDRSDGQCNHPGHKHTWRFPVHGLELTHSYLDKHFKNGRLVGKQPPKRTLRKPFKNQVQEFRLSPKDVKALRQDLMKENQEADAKKERAWTSKNAMSGYFEKEETTYCESILVEDKSTKTAKADTILTQDGDLVGGPKFDVVTKPRGNIWRALSTQVRRCTHSFHIIYSLVHSLMHSLIYSLMQSSHALLSCTPLMQSSHAILSYTLSCSPLMHSLIYSLMHSLMHSSHTLSHALLSYTLSCTPLIHSSHAP